MVEFDFISYNILTPRFTAYILLLLLSVVLGFWKYSKLSLPFRLLTQYIAIVLISEVLGKLAQTSLGSNYPFYHVLLFIQCIYFGMIFYQFSNKGRWDKRIFTFISAVLAMGSLLLSAFYSGFYRFPSLNTIIFSFLAIVGALYLYFQMLRRPGHRSAIMVPVFWFASGTLFFYAITFFFFGLFDFLYTTTETPEWGYHLTRISNYILYSCYFIAIALDSKVKSVKGADTNAPGSPVGKISVTKTNMYRSA